ncbi:regulator of chromosome condensation 1/beta-lactamase-inhibitor protein II [Mycena metata]|uniref:Regulator of chromosome condensation 1/beta-lactamase-inhibitor protein II n=1 Tax=Mycena metata TaxID=1033252 RepID=A0AAD7P249_9AGAR|nr:regulator of chromosome condensation 1/beta-lactamase-inhibitor protein II [Mycena metata]
MLLAAGSNAHGQLSNTTLEDSRFFSPCCFSGCSPGTLPANRRLLHLAFGANHTLALLESYKSPDETTTELWGCGDGKCGQLGPSYNNDNTSTLKPLHLSLERIGLAEYHPRLVAACWETTFVVLSCQDMPDVLISMGANDFGNLGVGEHEGKVSAKDVHVVRLDRLSQGVIPGRSDSLFVESLAAGQHHVIANLKTASGDLTVGWGTSRHGQLGNTDTPFASSPILIQTGRPDDAIISTAVGHQHTVFLHSSGTVSGLGSNKKRQLDGVPTLARAKSVNCTWNGTYTTTVDIDVWDVLSAGSNANGQLGRADSDRTDLARVEFPFTSRTHRLLQVACGSEHILASFLVLSSSTTEVWGWGWNEHGNLGLGTTEDIRAPAKIWQSQGLQGEVGIWAGSGTSWIVVQ